MSGSRPRRALLRFTVLLMVALAFAALRAPRAAADPARPTNDQSKVVAIQPATAAISVRVVGGDGFLELKVQRGQRVAVEGYSGEPWLRVLADGTVEENTLSPATYLDANRYATGIKIPADVDPKAPPQWKTVGHDGTYVWHDHRIHWMNPGVAPPRMPQSDQIRMGDRPDGKWVVPMDVNGRPVQVLGELVRHPAPSPGLPLGIIGAIVLAAIAATFLVRGRRPRLATASLLALAGTLVALFAGYREVQVVPAAAGGSHLVVFLPAGGIVFALASLVVKTDVAKCLLALLGALGAVGWALYAGLNTLWSAVPLSSLSPAGARAVMAASIGMAIGAVVFAVRSRALALPAPAPVGAQKPSNA